MRARGSPRRGRRGRRRGEEGVAAVGEVLAEDGDVAGDHRQAGGHGLEDDQAPALLDRGEGEGVGGAVPGGSSSSGRVPSEDDVAVQAQAEAGQAREDLVAVGGVVLERVPADDREHRRGVEAPREQAERANEVVAALARLDAADGQQERTAVGADACAAGPRGARAAIGRRSARRSTPLGTTVGRRRRSSSRRIACHCRLTTSTTSGSRIARALAVDQRGGW